MADRNLSPAWMASFKHQHEICDDFSWYITPHLWTSLASDAGSSVAVVTDGTGGLLRLTTGATDNNECSFATTNEIFHLQAGKSFRAGVYLQYTELTGNAANVAFGFGDDLTRVNVLGDDAAGVAAGFTTAILIWKPDAATGWRFHAENGSDSETYTSTLTAGGSSYQWLEIFGSVVDGVIDEYQFTFAIDGSPVLNTTSGRPLMLNVPYASASQLDFGVYAKAGAAESLVVNVDKIYAYQTT